MPAGWSSLRLPGSSSCDVVYEASDGAVLGHISATRVYSNTWLLHQLATVNGHAETVACRKMLYGLVCAAPNIYSGDAASGLAYFDLNKRWHRLFFEEFTHWIDDPREALITKLDRFERPDGGASTVPEVAGFRAERATEADLVLATAMARSQLPRAAADALDLQPYRLRAARLRGPIEDGYTRSREVFVLRSEGGLVAVALCELGSPELSLFDIMNMAHVFVPGVRQPVPVAAQLLLLARIRQYYAEHGVLNPLVVAPHATLAAEAEPGTRLVETMGCMAMTAHAMRQWENFCQFHFGHQLHAAD
jgi:hypothetical protein